MIFIFYPKTYRQVLFENSQTSFIRQLTVKFLSEKFADKFYPKNYILGDFFTNSSGHPVCYIPQNRAAAATVARTARTAPARFVGSHLSLQKQYDFAHTRGFTFR
jgi:hypothetical protein